MSRATDAGNYLKMQRGFDRLNDAREKRIVQLLQQGFVTEWVNSKAFQRVCGCSSQ